MHGKVGEVEITEVRVALREQVVRPGAVEGRPGEKRLKAYATVTFDRCFVVRNIKIIDGKNGLFVAMPSHKPKVACGRCQFKNELGARFCVQCGTPVSRPIERPARMGELESAEAQAHRDIAHPITAEFGHCLQQTILEAYEAERAKSQSHAPKATEADDESI